MANGPSTYFCLTCLYLGLAVEPSLCFECILFFDGFMGFDHIIIFLFLFRSCMYFLFFGSMVFVFILVLYSGIYGIFLFLEKIGEECFEKIFCFI